MGASSTAERPATIRVERDTLAGAHEHARADGHVSSGRRRSRGVTPSSASSTASPGDSVAKASTARRARVTLQPSRRSESAKRKATVPASSQSPSNQRAGDGHEP